jgi:hypothetical protein
LKLETGNWKFETGNREFETGNFEFYFRIIGFVYEGSL